MSADPNLYDTHIAAQDETAARLARLTAERRVAPDGETLVHEAFVAGAVMFIRDGGSDAPSDEERIERAWRHQRSALLASGVLGIPAEPDEVNPWPALDQRYEAAQAAQDRGELGAQLTGDERTDRVMTELRNAFAGGALWQYGRKAAGA